MPRSYDRFAPNYDKAFRPLERRFLRSLRAETLSMLPTGSEILEVGAGTGANFEFYPPCLRAVGSEPSARMLGFARSKTTRIDLIQADAQDLPFDANRFDAAFASLVFCSVSDPAAAFHELIRVVRPGGSVILLEHVRPPGVLGTLFDLLSYVTVALIDDHFNRRTASLAEKAGLNVLEVRKKAFGIIDLIVCRVRK